MSEWIQVKDLDYSLKLAKNQTLVIRNNKTHKILKHTKVDYGYMRVTLSRNGVGKQFYIHMLLLTYFGSKRPSRFHTPNHKDGNKSNNTLSNLEWLTPAEQQIHAYTTGLHVGVGVKGSKNHLTKYTEQQILEIRAMWDGNYTTKSYTALGTLFNIPSSTIAKIIRRTNWKHI